MHFGLLLTCFCKHSASLQWWPVCSHLLKSIYTMFISVVHANKVTWSWLPALHVEPGQKMKQQPAAGIVPICFFKSPSQYCAIKWYFLFLISKSSHKLTKKTVPPLWKGCKYQNKTQPDTAGIDHILHLDQDILMVKHNYTYVNSLIKAYCVRTGVFCS